MKTLSRDEFTQIFPAFRNNSGLASEILSRSHIKPFAKDQVIYSEGDTCSAIAFVISGEIRVFKIGEGGREITLYEMAKGDTCILNASCILSDMPYPAHAIASCDTELLVITAGDFRRMLSHYEEMRGFVFDLISQRLMSVMTLVEEVAFRRMDLRLLEYIEEHLVNGQLIMTHQKIANDLGTSREVVSRLLKNLEKQGMIILSRNLIQVAHK